MPPRKRTAAEAASASEVGASSSRRRSSRISLGGKKSTYFEGFDDDATDDLDGKRPPLKAIKTQAKGRRRAKKEESVDELQDERDSTVPEDDEKLSEPDDGDDAFEDNNGSEGDSGSEAPPPTPPPATRKRGRGRPRKSDSETTPVSVVKKAGVKPQAPGTAKAKLKSGPKAKAKAKADSESEGPEAEKDDDDDDEEENRITFIPAVKLRDTGGVEYEDTRLHKNTFLFLGDLKNNNKRSWLKSHDGEYRRALKDWESFVETLTEKIIEADYTIPELPIKDVVFRIYRDIRFSKDPTPYKPHFSAAWSRTGRKGPYAAYYIHVEPGRCVAGGGLWQPDKTALARMRASFDERPHRIRRVLMNPALRKAFFPTVKGNNEKAVLKAFADWNKENMLKTKPKGFHPEHKDIELLKLRNYTVGTTMDEADFLAEDAQDRVMGILSAMVEFVTFINSVVMPDPNVDSDSDDADGGAEEQEGQEEEEKEEEEEAESDDI